MESNNRVIEEGLEQVLQIANRRAQILEHLRQALIVGNDEEIRFFAAQICGLTYESRRVSEGVNTRTEH